jgi:hypothetical protein
MREDRSQMVALSAPISNTARVFFENYCPKECHKYHIAPRSRRTLLAREVELTLLAPLRVLGTMELEEQGNTLLSGTSMDQVALNEVLTKVRDLNLSV